MDPSEWEQVGSVQDGDNNGVMVSNLPLLFANGEPCSLQTMTQRQLERFVELMVHCSVGEELSKPWHKLTRPQWWPRKLPFKHPSGATLTPSHRSMLQRLVERCYQYHSCDFLLQFCRSLVKQKPKNGYKFTDNRDGTTSMHHSETGKLLVTFRNENREYDNMVGGTASVGKKFTQSCPSVETNTGLRPQLLPRKGSSSTTAMVAPVQDVYLCDHCDAEFASLTDVQTHERICSSASADASHCEVEATTLLPPPSPEPELPDLFQDTNDQVALMHQLGLFPALHTGVPPYRSPCKTDKFGTAATSAKKLKQPVRKLSRSSHLVFNSVDLSSPLGRSLMKSYMQGSRSTANKQGGDYCLPCLPSQQLVLRYERHLLATPNVTFAHTRDTSRGLTRWVIVYRSSKLPWYHHFSFTQNQRADRWLTIETGLEARGRQLHFRCRPCHVPLKRVPKRVIDRYTRLRVPSRGYALCIDLTEDEGIHAASTSTQCNATSLQAANEKKGKTAIEHILTTIANGSQWAIAPGFLEHVLAGGAVPDNEVAITFHKMFSPSGLLSQLMSRAVSLYEVPKLCLLEYGTVSPTVMQVNALLQKYGILSKVAYDLGSSKLMMNLLLHYGHVLSNPEEMIRLTTLPNSIPRVHNPYVSSTFASAAANINPHIQACTSSPASTLAASVSNKIGVNMPPLVPIRQKPCPKSQRKHYMTVGNSATSTSLREQLQPIIRKNLETHIYDLSTPESILPDSINQVLTQEAHCAGGIGQKSSVEVIDVIDLSSDDDSDVLQRNLEHSSVSSENSNACKYKGDINGDSANTLLTDSTQCKSAVSNTNKEESIYNNCASKAQACLNLGAEDAPTRKPLYDSKNESSHWSCAAQSSRGNNGRSTQEPCVTNGFTKSVLNHASEQTRCCHYSDDEIPFCKDLLSEKDSNFSSALNEFTVITEDEERLLRCSSKRNIKSNGGKRQRNHVERVTIVPVIVCNTLLDSDNCLVHSSPYGMQETYTTPTYEWDEVKIQARRNKRIFSGYDSENELEKMAVSPQRGRKRLRGSSRHQVFEYESPGYLSSYFNDGGDLVLRFSSSSVPPNTCSRQQDRDSLLLGDTSMDIVAENCYEGRDWFEVNKQEEDVTESMLERNTDSGHEFLSTCDTKDGSRDSSLFTSFIGKGLHFIRNWLSPTNVDNSSKICRSPLQSLENVRKIKNAPRLSSGLRPSQLHDYQRPRDLAFCLLDECKEIGGAKSVRELVSAERCVLRKDVRTDIYGEKICLNEPAVCSNHKKVSVDREVAERRVAERLREKQPHVSFLSSGRSELPYDKEILLENISALLSRSLVASLSNGVFCKALHTCLHLELLNKFGSGSPLATNSEVPLKYDLNKFKLQSEEAEELCMQSASENCKLIGVSCQSRSSVKGTKNNKYNSQNSPIVESCKMERSRSRRVDTRDLAVPRLPASLHSPQSDSDSSEREIFINRVQISKKKMLSMSRSQMIKKAVTESCLSNREDDKPIRTAHSDQISSQKVKALRRRIACGALTKRQTRWSKKEDALSLRSGRVVRDFNHFTQSCRRTRPSVARSRVLLNRPRMHSRLVKAECDEMNSSECHPLQVIEARIEKVNDSSESDACSLQAAASRDNPGISLQKCKPKNMKQLTTSRPLFKKVEDNRAAARRLYKPKGWTALMQLVRDEYKELQDSGFHPSDVFSNYSEMNDSSNNTSFENNESDCKASRISAHTLHGDSSNISAWISTFGDMGTENGYVTDCDSDYSFESSNGADIVTNKKKSLRKRYKCPTAGNDKLLYRRLVSRPKRCRELINLVTDECKELRVSGFHPQDIVQTVETEGTPFLISASSTSDSDATLKYMSPSRNFSEAISTKALSVEDATCNSNSKKKVANLSPKKKRSLTRDLKSLFIDECKELKGKRTKRARRSTRSAGVNSNCSLIDLRTSRDIDVSNCNSFLESCPKSKFSLLPCRKVSARQEFGLPRVNRKVEKHLLLGSNRSEAARSTERGVQRETLREERLAMCVFTYSLPPIS